MNSQKQAKIIDGYIDMLVMNTYVCAITVILKESQCFSISTNLMEICITSDQKCSIALELLMLQTPNFLTNITFLFFY